MTKGVDRGTSLELHDVASLSTAAPWVRQLTDAPATAAVRAPTRANSATPRERERARAGRTEELALTALMLLPGALIVFMGFNAGGNFPVATAIGALVLAQVLALRIVQSRHPFEGLAPATLVAIGALAGFTALTLASALWSHSPGRALIEFDRAWLYLLVLLLFGTLRPNGAQLRLLVRGLALGASIVCLAALISRLLPDVWHTAPDVSNERLSYPVTYWNALGLLAALGLQLAFHLTCSLAERRAVGVLAAAVIPLLAGTLFFTFSRGAIAAGAIGLVVYALLARPRGLLSGALACLAPSGAVLVFAYHASLLDTIDPTTPAAISQGHRVALVAALCAAASALLRLLLAARLDSSPRRAPSRVRQNRRSRYAVIAAATAVAVALVLAAGVPHALSHDWQRFASGATPHGNQSDFRQRLVDPANNGRTDLWRVAATAFVALPAHGVGAGLYETIWDRRRPLPMNVINAHSLYLQAAAELGAPGLALLLVLVGTVLTGLALRARGSLRSLYGVLVAVSFVWALHAGVDWDWEMPVVTLGFFAAAGAALSPRPRNARRPSGGWVPGAGVRLVLGMLCLASAALPVLIMGSQSRLDSAERALYASDCRAASSAALSSLAWLGDRSEPWEVVGFCDLQRGHPRLGVGAMEHAVREAPASWEPRYALALAEAAAGSDPRADAAAAVRLNPLEPLARQASIELRGARPIEWARRAAGLRVAALASNDLLIAPS
jgi:hypothetical protein